MENGLAGRSFRYHTRAAARLGGLGTTVPGGIVEETRGLFLGKTTVVV